MTNSTAERDYRHSKILWPFVQGLVDSPRGGRDEKSYSEKHFVVIVDLGHLHGSDAWRGLSEDGSGAIQ